MRRFFFLRASRSRKGNGNKVEHYSYYEQRKHMIDTLGYEAFELHPRYAELQDFEIPDCFAYVFTVFVDLYGASPNGITYPDIDAWERVNDEKLALYDVKLIRLMSGWAADENRKAREDE